MEMRVFFARIGEMKFYAGPQLDDPRPVGGGSYNDQHRGSELFNFKRMKNRKGTEILYGFVSPPKIGEHCLNIRRVDPTTKSNQLTGVTVIFVAGQKIIGWYRNATIFRNWREDASVGREWTESGERWRAYWNMKATVQDGAVLLPATTGARSHEIPRGKNGFGQANVRYTHDSSLTPDLTDWMKKAIEYVINYDGENLLTNPAADVITETADALEISVGFESDPAIRRLVEDHAMKRVEHDYRRNGYAVQNTSKSKPYDFLCVKSGKEVHVEVKGTQTSGAVISLTHNEVNIASDPRKRVDLCIVHSIRVTAGDQPTARRGVLVKYTDWDPAEHELKTVNYVCKLKAHGG